MFTLSGELTKIKATEKISDTFSKREFVLMESSGNFPNPIPMQLLKERCKILDDFKEGDEVTVQFSLQGNMPEAKEGQEQKAFCNVNAWSIKKCQ